MEVRSRPDWLKRAETKAFERKFQPRFSSLESDDSHKGDSREAADDEEGDGELAVIDVPVTIDPSVADYEEDRLTKRRSDAAEAAGIASGQLNLEQFETLKKRQEEQMQALLLQQTSIAHASLTLERERERLQELQQTQLRHTEIVIAQQRQYLTSTDEQQQRLARPETAEESCGGAMLQCGSDTTVDPLGRGGSGRGQSKKAKPPPNEEEEEGSAVFIGGGGYFSSRA